ncbi:MAG TPA: ATP-binding protein [Vicinamibacterales bacterium]|nr:ATP-binding protein [Vicinamibacterales bacterium]
MTHTSWQWLKRYRVWEANRKVFLYPENWIEPEPRSRVAAFGALAAELERSLFHVDLSDVVSKYIGETEKNLGKVFRAAERAGAVLLLDEADALFGKRTDVKDDHDRYANQEIACLLKRIEKYKGLAVLASNKRRGKRRHRR